MHKVVELSQHQRKPDPDVLLEICQNEGMAPSDSAYVGDSVARDVLMAKRAGVFAIWAKYGASHSSEEYAQLVRISHWTPEDVEREASLRREAQGVQADAIVENSFLEVLEALK
jgi:phosphoglycolate phosphatase